MCVSVTRKESGTLGKPENALCRTVVKFTLINSVLNMPEARLQAHFEIE